MCLAFCRYEVDIYEGRKWVGGKVASYVDRKGNHVEVGFLSIMSLTFSSSIFRMCEVLISSLSLNFVFEYFFPL